MDRWLLILHIADGVLSLSAPIGALVAIKGGRRHVLAGRALAAFTVTALKVRTRQAFLAFLLPALIIAPLSQYWKARFRRPTSTKSAVAV